MLARSAIDAWLRAGLVAGVALIASESVLASDLSPAPLRGGEGLFQRAATCGQGGLPPCPLQAFMRSSVAAPLARDDVKTIAASLEKVATLGPPEWKTWAEFARRGAAAAGKNDRAAIRSSCTDCHNAWRAEYRAR